MTEKKAKKKAKKKTAKKRGAKKLAPEKPKKGGAPKGNQFWRARSKHGRDKIFTDPEILWDACVEYFEWIEDNPLQSVELVKYQGSAKQAKVPKMRAMTKSGICLFLGISEDTWDRYGNDEDFCGIVAEAERVIWNQKFTGASADMLNPNIIARELGLRDSHEHGGPNGGPIPVANIDVDLSDDEAAKRYRDFIRGR